jgi:uncharacterized protein
VSAREDTAFNSAGLRCAAWLYRPQGAGDAAAPCVVMAHGFSAVRDQRLDAFAERFVAAGLACLVFDYRHFGDSEGQPRQLLAVRRQLGDWRSAVAFARGLPGIDPERIGLWGTSFSAGHVVVVAAGDPRVAAVVAQVPFSFGLSALRAEGRMQSVRLMGPALLDQLGAVARRPPRYVPAVGPPGALAAMTRPEAEPGFRAMTPAASGWVNRYAARLGLWVGWYRPFARLGRVRSPVLVVVGERDETTPAKPAIRAARRAPQAELVAYPIGHFEVYRGEWFERAVAVETEFLSRHLLAPRGAGATTVGAA